MLIVETKKTVFPNCSHEMIGQMCCWNNSAEMSDTPPRMTSASYVLPF